MGITTSDYNIHYLFSISTLHSVASASKEQGTSLETVSSKLNLRTSWVMQWLRIHLPMQGTWVRAMVQEDPKCVEQLSPRATTIDAAL